MEWKPSVRLTYGICIYIYGIYIYIWNTYMEYVEVFAWFWSGTPVNFRECQFFGCLLCHRTQNMGPL